MMLLLKEKVFSDGFSHVVLSLGYRRPHVVNNKVSQDGILKWLKFQQASVTSFNSKSWSKIKVLMVIIEYSVYKKIQTFQQ